MTVSWQRESSDVTDGSSRENTDVEGSDWPVRAELTGNGLCTYSGLKYESKYVSGSFLLAVSWQCEESDVTQVHRQAELQLEALEWPGRYLEASSMSEGCQRAPDHLLQGVRMVSTCPTELETNRVHFGLINLQSVNL